MLLLAVVAFGISGYRQGFIVGAMSFIGFLGGAILGAKLAPSISSLIGNGKRSPVTGIVVVFLGRGSRAAGRVGRWRLPYAPGSTGARRKPSTPWAAPSSPASRCCWWPG